MRVLALVFPTLLAGQIAVADLGTAFARSNTTACETLTAPVVPGLTALNITSFLGSTNKGTAFCHSELYYRHTNATDTVRVATWLPLSTWNGRYRGTGGGGFQEGYFDIALEPAVDSGYSASSSDSGIPPTTAGYAWANDTQLLTNFAYLGAHDMTVIGKATTAQFYGRAAHHSYWTGCSAGGRHGYQEAQSYPEDYNGIYAVAPGLYPERVLVEFLWAWAVEMTEGLVPACVLESFRQAAIDECDLLDGGRDGVIGNPLKCTFDPKTLVGRAAFNCTDGTTITAEHESVFAKINHGPTSANGTQLWYGLPLGADENAVAGQAPSIGAAWVANFLLSDPSWDPNSLTEASYPALIALSKRKWSTSLATDDPDLGAFRKTGGKLLTWQGFADPSVPPEGTIKYRHAVEKVMGGAAAANDFYRLFMAPGVGHCGSGSGAWPDTESGLAQLVRWVEDGVAPETLQAQNGVVTRDLCLWPSELRYKGTGDVNLAASWECRGPILGLVEQAQQSWSA